MKKFMLFSLLALFGFTGTAAADVNADVSSYDVEAYDYATSSDKFGIIRLYSPSSPNVVAYLHFHRSSTTFPTDRLYEDSAGRVHSHYYSSDWERILALLDQPGGVSVKYYAYADTFYLTRSSTVN